MLVVPVEEGSNGPVARSHRFHPGHGFGTENPVGQAALASGDVALVAGRGKTGGLSQDSALLVFQERPDHVDSRRRSGLE